MAIITKTRSFAATGAQSALVRFVRHCLRADAAGVVVALLCTAIAAPLWAEDIGDPSPPGSPTESPVRESPFVAVTQVSQAFQDRLRHAERSVPPQVWQGLAEAGWQLKTSQFVLDAVPSLGGGRPRGWPTGLTWENTDAVHLPRQKLLVIAEKWRDTSGHIVSSDRVAGILRHEIGHAFDMVSSTAMKFNSSTPQYVAAYQADIGRMSAEDRGELSYYLQSRSAGPQETFAEAFGVALGGGSDPPRHERFQRAFPTVIEYVRSAVEQYEPLPKTETARAADYEQSTTGRRTRRARRRARGRN